MPNNAHARAKKAQRSDRWAPPLALTFYANPTQNSARKTTWNLSLFPKTQRFLPHNLSLFEETRTSSSKEPECLPLALSNYPSCRRVVVVPSERKSHFCTRAQNRAGGGGYEENRGGKTRIDGIRSANGGGNWHPNTPTLLPTPSFSPQKPTKLRKYAAKHPKPATPNHFPTPQPPFSTKYQRSQKPTYI